MRRFLCLMLPALAGCLNYAAVDYTLDLKVNRAEIVYRDLQGGGWDDFLTLMRDLVPGDAFHNAFPKATVSREEVVPNGETLEVQVDLQGQSPQDLGLQPWDAKAPYRFCAPEGLVITSANATYKDADGCVVWKKGARVLRVHAVPTLPATEASLLPLYQKWVAAGRPDLTTTPPPAEPDPAAPSPAPNP